MATLVCDVVEPGGAAVADILDAAFSVSYDRSVRIKGLGVVPPRLDAQGNDLGLPWFEVTPNDDAAVHADDQGFGIIVHAEWTNAAGQLLTADYRVAVSTSVVGDDGRVLLSDLNLQATPVPLPEMVDGSSLLTRMGEVESGFTSVQGAATTAEQAAASAQAAAQQAATAAQPTDAGVAQLVASGAQTPKALAQVTAQRAKVQGLTIPPSVSHADVQAALDAAAKDGTRVQVGGAYTTDQTLVIAASCDLSQLTITYTGTGDAVVVGNASTGHLHRLDIRTPRVINGGYTTGQWGTARGVVLRNLFRCTIRVPHVKNFARGIVEIGDGSYGGIGGFAYNVIYVQALENNFINQELRLDSNGSPTQAFVNENLHIGGSWSHDGAAGNTTNVTVSGMRHIVVGNISNVSCNNNRWIGCSLEGTERLQEYFVECYGNDNLWLSCRWEHNWTSKPPVYWRNGAARNMIVGGYQADNIVHVAESSSAFAPTVIGDNSVSFGTSTTQGVVFANLAGGSTAAWSVMPGGWQQNGVNPSTGYTVRATQGALMVKAQGDTANRWRVDMGTRTMTLGSGIDTKAQQISWGANSPEGVLTANPGSLYFDYVNNRRYSKGSGTGNTGWRMDGYMPYATSARPTATVAGVGGTYFDTTLGKPVWSTGSSWVDATGTAV